MQRDRYPYSPLFDISERDTRKIYLARLANKSTYIENMPNERGPWDETPLHHAAMHGKLDIAKWLIEHGVDPEAKDANGNTAAQLARHSGHHRLARFINEASQSNERGIG